MNATHKVYLVHGFAGFALELEYIHKEIKKAGFICEIYSYPSMSKDIDKVAVELYKKIQSENFDTVSFVTHSLGALVVRSLYNHINPPSKFPTIFRIVNIAPPNNGTPVADFVSHYSFLIHILGPNVTNLTTNTTTGARKFPVPPCEIGLIAGKRGKKTGFNPFIKGDNDGLIITSHSKLGTEKDIIFVKSTHWDILYNPKVKDYVIKFLDTGRFR